MNSSLSHQSLSKRKQERDSTKTLAKFYSSTLFLSLNSAHNSIAINHKEQSSFHFIFHYQYRSIMLSPPHPTSTTPPTIWKTAMIIPTITLHKNQTLHHYLPRKTLLQMDCCHLFVMITTRKKKKKRRRRRILMLLLLPLLQVCSPFLHEKKGWFPHTLSLSHEGELSITVRSISLSLHQDYCNLFFFFSLRKLSFLSLSCKDKLVYNRV